MRIRALIIDSKPQLRRIVSALFDDIPSSQVTGAATTHEATLAIQSTHPNMIFLGYGSQDIHPDSLLSLIQKIKLRTVLIPVVETPTADLLKSLLPHPQVVDLLARDAEPERIRAAIQKALDHLFHSQLEPSTYRGFVGFVGVTPTLQQRKVLQTARLGILHNRSIRLAIEYWRKNPKSQLIAILLNTSY
ncbi:MAG: hypothetical protein RBU29_12695, partial [bacterium]|nr:hypothetical protein [bacterium]